MQVTLKSLRHDLGLSMDKDNHRPVWLISNYSFRVDIHAMKILESFCDSNPGVGLIRYQGGNIQKNVEDMSCWGLIPVFIEENNLNEAKVFFDEVLQFNRQLLTLYIHEINIGEGAFKERGIQLGKLFSPADEHRFSSGVELKSYVESKLSFFEQAHDAHARHVPQFNAEKFAKKHVWSEIQEELKILDKNGRCLFTRGKYHLYLTTFDSLRVIPKEIGRLRAMTFEEIGEGTGQIIDLDLYDQYYHQLFLVDADAGKIVGGYRLGCCDNIINKFGPEGLYTHALYSIDKCIHPILNQSIELGRSFIVSAYQKQHMPLFLLWNGILQFIKSNNQYKYILGMVSISRAYSDVSRSLIISYLTKNHYNSEIAKYFSARQAYHSTSSRSTLESLINVFDGELIQLDEFISEIEPKNYRLPVLIRKYINQNALFIGFNLDPNFSDCVDGLMLLDIADVPASTLQLLREK